MKKTVSILILLLSLVFVMACDLGSSEFEKAFKQFEEAESVKIEMVTSIPALDSDTEAEVIIDGNYAKISMDNMTIFEYMEDDKVYMLTPYGNNYMPVEIDFEDAIGFTALDLDSEDETYLEEDFELIEGWYVYQLDNGEFDEFKIKIEDDVITEMFFASRDGGLDVEISMTLSLYNEASFDFPDNVIDLDVYQEGLETLIENEFDFDFFDNEVHFAHGEAWIVCDMENGGICHFEQYPIIDFEFYATGDEFNYNGSTYTSLAQLYEAVDMSFDQEMFELILTLLSEVYY